MELSIDIIYILDKLFLNNYTIKFDFNIIVFGPDFLNIRAWYILKSLSIPPINNNVRDIREVNPIQLV